MTEVYQQGETVRLTATITDSAGAAANPTTTTISIEKPDGTLAVTDTAMTYSGTVGSYYYDYLIPASEGVYTVKVKATGAAGRISIEPDSFKAEATI